VLVLPLSLLIGGTLAALRQKFHLSACPNLPGHLLRTLYRTILGREVDEWGLNHFSALIARGASPDDVAASLMEAPEYLVRHPKPTHPLAQLAAFYTESDVSYFMHRGRFRPLAVSVETINICNNDCVICPYSSQTRKRGTMPMVLFRKFVRDYTEIGGGHISLTPLVGEVFLDKHLKERLQIMREAPAVTSVSVTTNAIMVHRFDDDHLGSLLGDIDRMHISVYGLDREEYFVMTKKDEYDLFRQSLIRILRLAKAGSVSLGARTLKRRSGEALDAWRREIAKDAGIESVEVTTVAHDFANWSFFDTTKTLPFDGEWRPVTQVTEQCGIPLLGMQIMSDGRVSFCACANFDGTPELLVGDLNNQSLAEILDLPQVARLWDWGGCGVPEFCKTCSFHLPLDRLGKVDWVYRDPGRFMGG
jgi:hypothetical protein